MKNQKKVIALLLTAQIASFGVFYNESSASILADSSNIQVSINVDTNSDRTVISPYIYGINPAESNTDDNLTVTAKRLGGNRFTGYNWENNASNAGSDWLQSSDNYVVRNYPTDQQKTPGLAVTKFHDESLVDNVPYSLVTLQMAGYVAKDMNGPVSEAEKAPSSRWVEVKSTKGSTFSDTPDLNDNYVYMDEFVNFLVKKYGKASSSTGIKGYCLDNEPGLWSGTHPMIHSEKVSCSELINKSVNLSKAIKAVDSTAEVFGPELYGFAAYQSLQSAPDWDAVKGNYGWFVDYYLDQMKKQSDISGKRLLDVLSVHWYPEATGGDKRITDEKDYTNVECNNARMQAPRTLWDPTYKENSWIAQWGSDKLPLLPQLNKSIATYNPGTKLAITEYNYGGESHISGGIAEADVLGIFGTNNVYMADLWPLTTNLNYVKSAINLYTNYDGKKSAYGNTKVKASTSDIANSSTFASIENQDDSKLHMIVINKSNSTMTANINLKSNKNYSSGSVFGFDSASSNITQRSSITGISNNNFSYEIPPLTVCHIILDSDSNTGLKGDLNSDGIINSIDLALLKRYLNNSATKINTANADVNEDGAISQLDYPLLKDLILKR